MGMLEKLKEFILRTILFRALMVLWCALFLFLCLTPVLMISHGEFNSIEEMVILYILQFALLVAGSHAFFLYILPNFFEVTLSSKLPRYIEYIYILVISVSLIQIVANAHEISVALKYNIGDRDSIVADAKSSASKYLSNECVRGADYFTPEFCSKIKVIAQQKDLSSFIANTLRFDRAFLNHPIGRVCGRAGCQPLTSRIALDVEQLNALTALDNYRISPVQSGAIAALTFALLPLGLAIRVLKTSLELFGEQANNFAARERARLAKLHARDQNTSV